MKMKNVYILGPSHIHSDFTNIVSEDIKYGLIFNGCTLDGHCGIPNWSRYIYDKINDIVGTDNYFLDSMGFPGNVDKNFMDTQHISTLGFHSLNIIDKIIKDFPNIKILFWCLYVRSRLNNSSYPNWLKYKSIKNRYMKISLILIDLPLRKYFQHL